VPDHLPEPDDAVAAATRHPLRRDEVVAAGLRLTRKDGLAGLSMRRLATELGVWPMALYRHVRNKEQLVALVVDAVLAEYPPPSASGASCWIRALRAAGREGHRLLTAHPGVAAHVLVYGHTGPRALRLAELMLADLRRQGLSGEDAVLVFLTVSHYVVCSAATDAPFGAASGGVRSPTRRDRLAAWVAAVTAGRHDLPTLSELLPAFGDPADSGPSSTRFEAGLDSLLAGLGQRCGHPAHLDTNCENRLHLR
jgi:AcrR family transcriptional regulator